CRTTGKNRARSRSLADTDVPEVTMKWSESDFSAKLKEATDSFARRLAARLVEELVQHLHGRVAPYPEHSATNDLQNLRDKRYFALMARLGDAFLRQGVVSAQVSRQYAQALLDLGH